MFIFVYVQLRVTHLTLNFTNYDDSQIVETKLHKIMNYMFHYMFNRPHGPSEMTINTMT